MFFDKRSFWVDCQALAGAIPPMAAMQGAAPAPAAAASAPMQALPGADDRFTPDARLVGAALCLCVCGDGGTAVFCDVAPVSFQVMEEYRRELVETIIEEAAKVLGTPWVGRVYAATDVISLCCVDAASAASRIGGNHQGGFDFSFGYVGARDFRS